MDKRIITDISNFIFVSDKPEAADAIFLPGGSHPEQPEYAVELYHQGYAKWLVPSGGVSVKRDKWPGVRSKSDIYDGDYRSDCEFFTDVFLKNGVPASAIIGEDKSGHTRDNAFFSRKAVDEDERGETVFGEAYLIRDGVITQLCKNGMSIPLITRSK